MTKTRCLCDQCCHISPMAARLRGVLPEELRGDFDYLTMTLMCAEEDRDVARAKLAGEWPGWEWMKDAVRAAEYAEERGKGVAKV